MADDPLLALLQQQLTGGLSLGESVEQLAQSDPKLGQIAQLLAQREEHLQKELDRQELEEQQLQDVQRMDDRRERAAALRRHVEEMAAEMEALLARLDEVAGALGACPSCWGEQSACRWCRGRGRPGFMPPDPDGFDHLVMPAVRVHAYLRRRDAAEHDHQPTQERSAS
ncbi:MAG: hypothetical protein ACRDTG_04850 [Pseudonocardiaceae bacterium]